MCHIFQIQDSIESINSTDNFGGGFSTTNLAIAITVRKYFIENMQTLADTPRRKRG